MHRLHLCPSGDLTATQSAFIAEAAELEGHLKVYRTFCVAENRSYILATASEEAHGEFGRFSAEGQLRLCCILRDEFETLGDTMLTFSFSTEADEKIRGGMIVTKATTIDASQQECTTFLFAPAQA